MAHKYISLPIELASDETTEGIFGKRTEETIIVCYLVSGDVVGFSEILSEKDKEYMCESEEEFHKLVGEYRLLRML